MMSGSRAPLLATEPRTRVTLVYGNRGSADVIFREAPALAALEDEQHGARSPGASTC